MENIEDNKIAHKKELRIKHNKNFYEKHKEYYHKYYLNSKNKYCCEICNVNFFSKYDKLKHEETKKHKNFSTYIENNKN